MLKKHVGPLPRERHVPPVTESDALAAGYHAIDRIVAHKYDRGTLKFLVKWENCSDDLNEWVPQSKVTDAAKESYKLTPEYEQCKAHIQQQKDERAAKA